MRDRRGILSSCCAIFIVATFSFETHVDAATENTAVLTGKAAMGDWTSDAPGVRRHITVSDLPSPSSNAFAINRARVIDRPANECRRAALTESRAEREQLAPIHRPSR